MAAIGATLALAFAAVSAGYSPLRVTFILILTLVASISALYSYRAYLAWQRKEFRTRSLPWVITTAASTIVLVAAFISWPFGSNAATGSSPQLYATPSSCELANLPAPQPVTPAMASAPLMYGIRSTDTAAGDNTAVAHEIFADGWMQQVFLATGTKVANASAVISLNLASFKPFVVRFEVINSAGRVIGAASAIYDGSTNNTELHAIFSKPVPLRRGSLYALRVINESVLTIAVYAHVYNGDPALTAPYPIPGCVYDSADGGPKAVPMLDNNHTYQMLSGTVYAS